MCTIEKRGQVFILTLTGDDEHRLSLRLIVQIRLALARVRSECSASPFSALLTRAEGKFFSNGFDLSYVNSSDDFASQFSRSQALMKGLSSITSDLMTLPMPTICAITGEISAVGFMLAFSHDYVAMNGDHGFLSLSELDTLLCNQYVVSLMKAKVRNVEIFKDLVLHFMKIPAKVAMEKGVLDLMEETAEETVEAAVKLGQMLAKKNWNGEVYVSMRMGTSLELCKVIGLLQESEHVVEFV